MYHFDDSTQKLFLKPTEDDSEVDHGHLDAILGREVWVAQAGGEIESEILVVFNINVHKGHNSGLLALPPVHDRIEGRVQRIWNTLKNEMEL